MALLPEPHFNNSNARLNRLRAAVLGADDGIVSVAGIVMGVAGATEARAAILTAGIAGLVAGALSMAAGEYVSVSSQRDTERALLDQERKELTLYPQPELAELAKLYEQKGLSSKLASLVAAELTSRDAFAAHVDIELGIDPHDLTNPWQAASTSAVSFTAGALIPLVAILLSPDQWRLPVTVAAVVLALALTGAISAKVGQAPVVRAMLRVMGGGALAMAVTYGIGRLIGGVGF